MKHTRTPWVQKLRPDLEPKVVRDPRGGGRLLVPTPLVVALELRKVRAGRLITPDALRARLARRHDADLTCPLTTGIFLNILAGAAEEQIAAGKRPVAPYWRVVDGRGRLSEKTPPGPARQAEHLKREGHSVRRVSERWCVVGFEERLV